MSDTEKPSAEGEVQGDAPKGEVDDSRPENSRDKSRGRSRSNSRSRSRSRSRRRSYSRSRSRSRDRDRRRGRSDSRGRGRGGERQGASLLVRNLSYRVSPHDLRDKFDKYGDIKDVYIPLDYRSREPKGFAFVEFFDRYDAEDALRDMDGREIKGKTITIVLAKERRKTAQEMRNTFRGGRGGRRRSRSRSRDRYSSRRRSRSRSRSRDRSRSRSRSRSRDRRRSRSYSR